MTKTQLVQGFLRFLSKSKHMALQMRLFQRLLSYAFGSKINVMFNCYSDFFAQNFPILSSLSLPFAPCYNIFFV